MKTLLSVALLVLVCLFQKGDAQITGWTVPSITGASGTGASPISFPENHATGSTSTTFSATPTSGSISSYNLLTTSGTPFTVVAGVLTLNSALDFETTPSYTIEIEAVDDNSPANSGTATVSITVTDVNEAPTFTASTFTTCVADGATSGASVTTLTANDQDSGDTITYSIASGNTNSNFMFSGGILQTANTIPSTPAQYVLVVHATDNDATPLTGTTTVTVNVQSASECNSGATVLSVSILTMFTALVVSLN